MRTRPRNIPALAAAIVASAVAPAAAQGEPERPSGAQRLVRLFDFEESTNPLPVPLGWIRAQHDPAVPRDRPGFPIWNQARLDTESPAFSGRGSALVPASGGSASLRMVPAMIGVFPGADYAVTARVRTERMVHARAALAARLLDQDGRPLARTEAISRRVRTDGEWTTVQVQVPGLDDRAAYLQVELLVLQPMHQPGSANHLDQPFRVWNEDFHAAAWFDDVAITLLPRIELDTGVPGHVIASDQQPVIDALIRDLTGEQMNATLRVFDADGREVDARSLAPAQGRVVERFIPALPAPGWYRAVLAVETGGRIVGKRALDFAWGAPEDERRARPPSFAIRAPAVDPAGAGALPTMVSWAGVGRAVVGLWDESLDRATAGPDHNPAFAAVRALLDRGVDVTASLDEAPRDLAVLAGRDPWDVPGVLGTDESIWMPWADAMLDQLGQGVLSWQLGVRSEAWGGRWVNLTRQIDSAAAVFEKWVPGPELRAAWEIGHEVPADMVRPGRGLVVRDDGAGADDTLGELVSAWAGAGRFAGSGDDRSTLTIEFPASTDGRVSRAALGKLARRLVTSWAAARRAGVSDRVQFALVEPWRTSAGLRPSMMPTPELAAWRTLASVLGADGTQQVRELDLLPGVRIFLAGAGDEGVLIAWLEDPDAPRRVLDLPLGVGPVRRVDLLGERRELQPTEQTRQGLSWHRVELSREPVIIEGVRTELVRFLSSVRFAGERFDPVLGPRPHALVIENPWDFPVRGRVFIVEPGGMSGGVAGRDRSWQIDPRVVPFSLDAGQRVEQPIDLSFGAGQESGWTDVVFDVQLFADEEYPLLRVNRLKQLAAPDLQLEVVAYRAGGPAGAVSVHAIVTNRAGEARSVELAAIAPGASRERATINGLARGDTGERRFLFFGIAPGARISVGLTEPKTGVRLMRTIDAP